ncbi:MAG: DHH family phosphoesterase [Desulfovibrionaceae bacterium]|nr:DHH family phosphoesterase [Desulfovibrionaceae bacterium]
MSNKLSAVESAVVSARRTLIVSHINPDGDAVGSCAALARIIQDLGNEARIFLHSGVPDYLSWLPLPAPLLRSLAELDGWKPDLVLFADCGDMDRPGEDISAFMRGESIHLPRNGIVTANIDHHISNPDFADINWVEAERSATGELVGLLAESLNIPLSGELGEALYLAIVSDTGNFSYTNTSADCLAMAARIVDLGLDVGRFTANYENNWSLARMHLWGRLMAEITLHEQGAIVCSVVPRRYLQELGLDKDALEGYASWLRKLRGVRVALFVREDGPSHTKISLRSMGDISVHEVAALFGGGGHAAAAGADLNLPPQEAADRVLEALCKTLRTPR